MVRTTIIVVAALLMSSVFCWALSQVARFIAQWLEYRAIDNAARNSLRAPRLPSIRARDYSAERDKYERPWNQGGDDGGHAA